MTTYVTAAGDMWDKIAFDRLGDEKYTDLLIAENPDYRKVYIFPTGIKINIPNFEKKTTADSLPPWKRVSI